MAVTWASGVRLRPIYMVVLVAVIILFLLYGGLPNSQTPSPITLPSGVPPTNATLGFGGLYVVSGPGSPRRKHLEEAAAVTGLLLTIPDQHAWTTEDLRNFQIVDYEKSKVGEGSIKAWLSHHLVLKTFLESGQETALVLEDDVDWDIRIKTVAAPLAQQAARSMFSFSSRTTAREWPWATGEDWDLLYLGHCGDYMNALDRGVGVGYNHPEELDKLQHVIYADPTIPSSTDLHPFTSSLLTALQVPEHARLLHRSRWPLCTFGYAVTRKTAERLIQELAPAKEDAEHPITAYDAAILTACRDGPLRCFSLQPEFFHHQPGDSMIATVEKEKHEVFLPPVDKKGQEQTKYRGETSNIDCGFWSGHFYYDGDQSRLAYLQEEVGRKGRCLKDDRHTH